MKDFMKKVKTFIRAQSVIDNYIWSVFSRYIRQENIIFSDPDYWEIDYIDESNLENTYIYFNGKDGCMGCYDSKALSIPIKFFIDPDKELEILKKERIKKEEEKKSIDRLSKLNRERKEYERLKEIFENKIDEYCGYRGDYNRK